MMTANNFNNQTFANFTHTHTHKIRKLQLYKIVATV